MKIVLFGASGLVGGLLGPCLSGHELICVGRRATAAGDCVAPVADWPAVVADIKPDVVISTLGTTIRKAGSRAGFAAIDHDAVLAIAEAARAAGTRQFMLVSSVGANARALNFYLATKGRVEDDVIALGFERTDIFRPGLLVAARAGDPRFVEQLMMTLSPVTNLLTPPAFDRYRAIAARDVAAALAGAVGVAAGGVHIHHNREMLESARKLA